MEALQREYDEFKQPDVDGDDRISRTEFNMYVKNYLSNYPGLTEKDYPKFEDFDHDHDGYVSFQEYAQQMAVQAQQAELDQYYAQSQGKSGQKEAAKANALYDLYGSAANAHTAGGGFDDLYAQIRRQCWSYVKIEQILVELSTKGVMNDEGCVLLQGVKLEGEK